MGLTVIGVVLLVVTGLVAWAAGIGGASCTGVSIGCGGAVAATFFWPGVGLLLAGIGLTTQAVVRTLRAP